MKEFHIIYAKQTKKAVNKDNNLQKNNARTKNEPQNDLKPILGHTKKQSENELTSKQSEKQKMPK